MGREDLIARNLAIAEKFYDGYHGSVTRGRLDQAFDPEDFAEDWIFCSPYLGGETAQGRSTFLADGAVANHNTIWQKIPDYKMDHFRAWPTDDGCAWRWCVNGHAADGTSYEFWEQVFIDTCRRQNHPARVLRRLAGIPADARLCHRFVDRRPVGRRQLQDLDEIMSMLDVSAYVPADRFFGAVVPSQANRASNTWLIDYQPFIEQSLLDLIEWVEKGIDPVETDFEFRDSRVILPRDADERRGIQAVIAVTANGGTRAEVAVGETVTMEMRATVPPGAGTIVAAEWDFDGQGRFPFSYDGIDGTARSLTLRTTHAFGRPGEYFVTGRVHSHREGDVHATARRIPNLAQARVVVG